MLEQNPNPKLLKRIIITLRTIVSKGLFFLVDRNLTEEVGISHEEMEDFWNHIQLVPENAIQLGLNHNNETIKLYAIKLLETLVISFSLGPDRRLFFVTPQRKAKWCTKNDDFRLELIPTGHPVLKAEELSKRGDGYFSIILDFATRIDTSHTCITTILQSLLNICKSRSEYWERIISSLTSFLENTPESYSKSQKLAIRFELKAIFLFF